LIKDRDAKRLKGEQLTDKEKFLDVERQYKERSMQIYPNTLGITGQVFRTGQYTISNVV
jgi:hypothetical protein